MGPRFDVYLEPIVIANGRMDYEHCCRSSFLQKLLWPKSPWHGSSLKLAEAIWRHGHLLALLHHALEDGLIHVPGLHNMSMHAWKEMITL